MKSSDSNVINVEGVAGGAANQVKCSAAAAAAAAAKRGQMAGYVETRLRLMCLSSA